MRMVVDMKVLKVMAWGMEKVNFIIKKVAIMMGNGKIIICMVSEGFTTQIINLLMKDIGLLINSMEKEKFIMMNLHIFKILLTIKILIIWNKNGNIMKMYVFF